MKRIGYLGAYSIDNPGDALIGFATRQSVRAIAGPHEAVTLAPRLPGAIWRHAWDAARGLDGEIHPVPADDSIEWARDLDALVIGGGGLINLHPAFRPFLLGDARRWSDRVPAAWNAIGSQSVAWYLDGFDDAYAAIRACASRLVYRGVRNRMTERFLRGLGVAEPLSIVPDPVLALTPTGEDRSSAILRAAGVDPECRVIGVSVGSAFADRRCSPFYDDLFAALSRHAADARIPTQLLLIPFGGVYGDQQLVAALAGRLPSARVIAEPLGALDCWRLIGRLSFYVCARYHAVLAAFANDVPFLACDEYFSDFVASSKIRELLVTLGLEPLYACPFLASSPAVKLDLALRACCDGKLSFGQLLLQQRARLEEHYRDMIAALRI